MEKRIFSGADISVPKEKLQRLLRIPEDDENGLADEAAALFEQAKGIAMPKALCSRADIEHGDGAVTINGVRIENAFVAEKLAGCGYCVAYVITCGLELEKWAAGLSDMMASYWADGIKLIALEAMRNKVFDTLKDEYFADAKHISSLNPGSLKEWPLPSQRQLFDILGGVTGDIGVRLTDSFLMLPAKSVSGLMFSSADSYENCMLCPKLSCPNRRAAYIG